MVFMMFLFLFTVFAAYRNMPKRNNHNGGWFQRWRRGGRRRNNQGRCNIM